MKNRIRQFICLWLLMFASIAALSQTTATLPGFRIGRTDKTYFSNQNLAKGKPVLLVYFQPDCDDCRKFTKALLKQAVDFKQVQIVMVTNTGLSQLIAFEKEFKLRGYKNIVVGTEGYTMVLQRALNVQSFPYAAAYNRKRKLIKIFSESKDPSLLLNQIKMTFNGQKVTSRQKRSQE
jgi:thiol-disulfide isomerase/thioredoxin